VDRETGKTTVPVKLGLSRSHKVAYAFIVIPVCLLLFLIRNLHPLLIYPLVIALALILFSYRYPAEKGIYWVAGGITLF